MIFAGLLCPQLIKPSALLRHALEIPDQVVVWEQVYCFAVWNDQTVIGIFLILPLVRETGGFLLEENQMKRLYPNHDLTGHLLPGEHTLSDISMEKECPRKDQNRAA